jgi:insulysin
MEAEADNKIEEGLSRFGSFFASPLFTPSATDRELNAIDSENAKNLQSDVFRIYQIEKSRATSAHPFSKFYTGNRKTLLDGTKEKGIDLRQELVNFWEKYYSANQMTLAIVAPQSISTLKKMVKDSFSNIPNRNVPKPELAWRNIPAYGGPSVIDSFGSIVQVVPVQDLRQITLSWPILYETEQDRRFSDLVKADAYICHLLGHEGPGSLLSYLKQVGWANAVGCSSQNELSDFETLDISVDLTSQGLAAAKDVTGAIFSYLSMLRKEPIPDYIFSEVLQLEELEWRYLTKGNPSNYVSSLVTAMQKYPPSLYIAGPRRLALAKSGTTLVDSSEPRRQYSSREQEALVKKLAKKLIDQLTYDKVLITVMSKTFEAIADKKEKWYGTKYAVNPISSPTLNLLRNPSRSGELGLRYPKQNVFIPSEEGLRVKRPPKQADKTAKRSFEARMTPIPPPRLIRDDGPDGRWSVYFKEDEKFGQPKAYVVFQLLTPDAMSTPERAVLGQLYQTCATDRLEEYAYDARLAGLTYDVQVLPRGVRLTFGGYNDKLQEFAKYVSKKLTTDTKNNVIPKDEKEFERYKDNIMRGLSAFDVKQPYAHASYYSYLTLKPRKFEFPNADLRKALRETTLADLERYVDSLWKAGHGEALVQGNLDRDEALELVDAIDKTLDFEVLPASKLPPRIKALPLPTAPKVTRISIAEPNPSNENSAAHVVLQSVVRTEKDHVLIELLSAIIEDPFYADLRTQQQLGYIVGSGVRAIEETRTIAFIVQSSIASADRLASKILEFLDTFEDKTLQPLNDGDIAVYVKGLIDRKTEPDKTLAVEVTRNWSEIASGRLQFDRIQREAAALLDITKADLVQFWRRIYKSKDRRMLISTIIPRLGVASSREPPESAGYSTAELTNASDAVVLGIKDIAKFRKDREGKGEATDKKA